VKPCAYPMHKAPRCSAHSKRTGLPCMSPAVSGWSVCRMHGARGGAQAGKAHPNYRHGCRSAEFVRESHKLADMVRDWREIAKLLGVS
jgi:hypothetical protein